MQLVGDVTRDLAWAVRTLRRRPTFTVVAVLTLALEIGSNSAIFTLLSAHFLAPLPYERPDDLVLLWEADRATGDITTVSPGNYYAWKETAQSLSAVAAFNVDGATLSGEGGAAEDVAASIVTPDFFSVLGVQPELGSTFTPESAREASGDLVVLSHPLWVGRYGGDPEIVGRTIRIDGRPHTVVGVMPAAFRQPERQLSSQGARLWRPLLLDGEHDDFEFRYLRTVARIAPGSTLDQVRAEMTGLSQRLTEAHPDQNGAWTVTVRTLDDYLLGDARPILLLLLAAGAAILLIVCANVANLTLARGQERHREFAVRTALGAGGGRLVRQVLVEGLVLAAAGAAVGMVLVYATHGTLQAVQHRYFSGLVDVAVNGWVVGLTSAVALVAGLLFALPLARTAAADGVAGTLREGDARGGSGRRAARTRDLLIVGQVALATTLLVASALLTRSFDALVNVPPGFDPAGRVTFDLFPPRATYPHYPAVQRYYQEIRRTVEAVPGVTAMSMTSDLPFTSENRWTPFGVEGTPYDESTAPKADYHSVLPDYFQVMGIPLVQGRIFDEVWDPVPMEGAPVVVNRRMASMLAPDGDPLGRGLQLVRDDSTITLRVVGVVEDVLDDGYAAHPEPIFYLPVAVSPPRGMSMVVRLQGDVGPVMGRIRQAVASVDPDIPAGGLRTLDALLAETVARPRAASRLGSLLALLALLVAAAGIYGVLSYAVQSRTREIGIRAALGAVGGRLMSMVLGHSTRLLTVGLVLGLAGALAVGGALSGMLFGVRSWDPLSLLAAVVILGFVGTLAAWVPAHRAVHIDPREALRAD